MLYIKTCRTCKKTFDCYGHDTLFKAGKLCKNKRCYCLECWYDMLKSGRSMFMRLGESPESDAELIKNMQSCYGNDTIKQILSIEVAKSL